jgi:Ran GTPase-activating protein (RanGAP) involved in mRNA processing and transport
VALLSSHTELEELDLRDSAVTDAGLTTLVKLTNLKRLDLRGAPVTEGGCQRLAKTLSNCEILR